MDNFKIKELKEMDTLFDELFPILRSITGEGLRQSLKILQKYIPLEIEGIDSNSKVYDWTVPKEWVIRDAWIKDTMGNTIIDIKINNLHVINYSEPINKVLELEELKKIFIPYLINPMQFLM